jgi:hypothetical protein
LVELLAEDPKTLTPEIPATASQKLFLLSDL